MFFISVVFSVALIVSIISWSVHISMVKEQPEEYGYATFKKFKKEFDKCRWEIQGYHGKTIANFALWDMRDGSKFGASIIQFQHKGMIMNNPLCWMRAVLYAKKTYDSLNMKKTKNTVKW
ncbi:hypothetical protein [Halalkalibacter oceani]|uniref:hypothetical protein n=1 Tax=Halalkalibacter oceani TaxID=1653776 RepID=UPI0033958994